MQSSKLGTAPVPRLLWSMALPAVAANVVNAIYNIVDQIFIGHKVGFSGNAATSIAFPLTTVCLAIGLGTGLGAAAGYNLELGRGRVDEAKKYAGTVFSSLLIAGVVICIGVRTFLRPLMIAFGATDAILDYAVQYAGITAFGIPFLLFSLGINPLVRGDGSPTYSMLSIVAGALCNVALDALFMLVLHWGMAGAAWATVIGQAVSAGMLALYYRHFKNVCFSLRDLLPDVRYLGKICALGFASFAYQGSMVLVQVTLNNLLRKYGGRSDYGSEVTLAVSGIVAKVNAIFSAAVIGLVQGSQPICSYNYGAKQYARVRQTVRVLLIAATAVSVAVFAAIELFPEQIIRIFGDGDKSYFEFAALYARGFAACLFLNGVQISSATFFPSIGMPVKGAIISLSKQLLFFLPLMLILSHCFGIRGLIYATPATDVLAFGVAAAFLLYEMKHLREKNDGAE